MKAFCIFIFCLISGHQSSGSEWSYEGHKGTNEWATEVNEICGQKFQSPIDIAENHVVPDHGLIPINFNGYDQTVDGESFGNNGHSITLTLTEGGDRTPFTFNDEFNQTYTALQLHFHWRASSKVASGVGGSEHTVNGKHSPIEMHIVHIKHPYTSVADIKDMRDGLAVIGVLLEVNATMISSPYEDILSQAPLYKDDKRRVQSKVKLADLLPRSGSYYRYYGSLTTPPCYETVKWTLMKEPVQVPETLLTHLTEDVFAEANDALLDDGQSTKRKMGGNYRPVQPLSGRKVTEYLEFGKKFDKESHENHDWSYHGSKKTSKWTKISGPAAKGSWIESCGLQHQSPIDIRTDQLTNDASLVGTIAFSSSYEKSTSGKLLENGHTMKYALNQDEITFSEGQRTYRALQVHFHWAPVFFSELNEDYSTVGGSEHTVDGAHFPIEMHIVHEKLSGGEKDGSDDLGVLGAFFQVSDDASKIDTRVDQALAKLTSYFMDAAYKGSEIKIFEGPVLKDLLPVKKSYYRYMGSLTTPPCTEAVLWTVFSEAATVSEERFFEFQRLLRLNATEVLPVNAVVKTVQPFISGNFRPTQELNQRTVYFYAETSASAQIIFYVITIAVAAGILALGVFIYRNILSSSSSSSRNNANYTRGNTSGDDTAQVNTEITHAE